MFRFRDDVGAFVEFREVDHVDGREFREALVIYAESFPLSGRQPIAVIEERVTSGKEKMFVGCSDQQALFMALIWPLQNTDFVLLDYMATKRVYRNTGIGTRFLRNIFEISGVGKKHIIVEVEDPQYADNKQRGRRRVEFYRRNGAKEMKDAGYILPPLSAGAPTRMIVMILSPENMSINKLPGGIVRGLFIQIYGELYGRAADDSLLSSFVNDVPPTIRLV